MLRRSKVNEVADADLVVVARVAERERWPDIEKPPAEHSGTPRTLEEMESLAKFTAHLAAADPAVKRRSVLRLRLAVAAGTLLVLGVCWWVSPTRTALALIGGGLFCLVALRRSKRSPAARRAAFGR